MQTEKLTKLPFCSWEKNELLLHLIILLLMWRLRNSTSNRERVISLDYSQLRLEVLPQRQE